MLKNYLLIFLISMVPIIELRGAIPIGLGMGLPVLPTYLLCVLGNMIPVPFIYLFARKFLIWGYHKPLIGPICRFCINKGEKGGRALEAKAGKGMTVALLLFVASSRMRMRGFFRKIRAMETRCFWPPESMMPRSPTMVS